MEDKPVAPVHLGIIMDGNGRWAKKRSLPRTAGHAEGLKALKRVICEAAAQGIGYVTFYTFSTENWKRSEQEVAYLMHLFVAKIHGELSFYNKHGIRILARGDLQKLPMDVQQAIEKTVFETRNNTTITAIVAINYGGRDEICRAVNKCIALNPGQDITEASIADNLDLPQVPPVDMIVRSANEKRLSNFLLWDSAYAELAFYEKYWPDWNEEDVRIVCHDYSQRVRKFGGIE
ncbi:polyprenyl diphosphate synthase [Sphaerochaeta globosa]|uniref:Isoprenyl transferase n=1 Tax=Sphaerochaeta globosa (strain ATCC BAA-1886 / DSM 22777 / Buddy) TaxID=158189 RepID=F0RVP8_SPHGB|nr:polyprenyl diphosphate synthase [Sphaerochaeta globosa]ADY13040.1 Undecaprenyl pyrophosphate synthase [Sphaerochaeta globosa str. Buddy]